MAPKANTDPIGDLMAMLLFSYLQPLLFSSKAETIPYSQFKQYVDQGVVGELVIERRAVLDDLAKLLSQQESLQGEELRTMLSAAGPMPSSVKPYRNYAGKGGYGFGHGFTESDVGEAV